MQRVWPVIPVSWACIKTHKPATIMRQLVWRTVRGFVIYWVVFVCNIKNNTNDFYCIFKIFLRATRPFCSTFKK